MKTFERGKNAKKLGIDTTRKFVVVIDDNDDDYTREGDILELYGDDGSTCPYFNNLTTGDTDRPYYWSELYYADSLSLRDMINSGQYNDL